MLQELAGAQLARLMGNPDPIPYAARQGRNPQTGEEIQIPKKTVVKFRVAKACKDAVVPPKK